MEPGPLQSRPLGEILVGRGLMSQEHLEDALLEQRVSRKRLGAILVDSRVVTPQDLTSALRAQVQGVAGGVDGSDEAVDEQDGERPRRFLRRRRSGRDDDSESDSGAHTQAAMLRELLTITESQNSSLRREIERTTAELELTRLDVTHRQSRIAELEGQLHALQNERAQLADGLRAEIRELESDLRSVGVACTAAPPPPAPPARPPEPVTASESYLVLIPGGRDGHTLRTCAGAPPPVGRELELDGRRYLVLAHRRSLLGLDDRICAHVRPS